MGSLLGGITGYKRKGRFVKQYDGLDPKIKKAVDKMLVDVCKSPLPRGYNPEELAGRKGVYRIRVNRQYRATFEYDHDDASIIVFRNIASHDQLYSKP